MDLTKQNNFNTYLNKFSSLKEKQGKKQQKDEEIKEGDRVLFYFNNNKVGEGVFISTENGTIIGNFTKERV